MADGLLNLGPKSRAWLAELGIHTGAQLRQRDAFQVYAQLKQRVPGVSVNLLYALLGAQDDCHWLAVQRERRTEVLMRLDDMGLAPRR